MDDSTIALLVDDNKLISGNCNNKCFIWDLNKEKLINLVGFHNDSVSCLLKYENSYISASDNGKLV